MTAPAPVMVVDDDLDICESLQLALELNGYAVLVATDGAQALAKLRDGARPRLILLDLMMPIMSGQEFRVAQLADPALAAIPVVVLSGDRGVATEAAALGTTGVQKPVDLPTLLALVAAHGGDA